MKASTMTALLKYVPETNRLTRVNSIALRVFFDAVDICKNEGLARAVVLVHTAWYDLWQRYNVADGEYMPDTERSRDLAVFLTGSRSVIKAEFCTKCDFRDEVIPEVLSSLCATFIFCQRVRTLIKCSSDEEREILRDLGL